MKSLSLYALLLCYLGMFYAGMFYYPKWRMPHSEATIGWDVFGYYAYLPAIFIYKDLKQLSFQGPIIEKYHSNPGGIQAHRHEKSGNLVLKYSSGMAVMYSPFFAIAHTWAKASGGTYPADGFSFPYQFMISLGSLLIAFLGLFVLRKLLLQYFSEAATALAIISIALVSNYLEYAAISGAMTHNYQFTIFVSVLYFSHIFYQKPSFGKAAAIGLLCGLAALTRPTDLLIILMPLGWGLNLFSIKAIKERLQFFWTEKTKLALAIVCTAALGSVQAFYWKYTSGDWIVYSYKGEGFSWLNPHFVGALFSYKIGWLVYSPIMYLSLFGLFFLFKKERNLWPTIMLFFLIYTYVVCAWDNWWYGGGLGQRAMIQGYAVLSLPMAAFWEAALKKRWAMLLLLPITTLFLYYNIWLTHQAHKGGLLPPAEVTKAYFWRVLGRYSIVEEEKKLLDTDELFEGTPKNKVLIWKNDFEADSVDMSCGLEAVSGQKAFCLSAKIQNSPLFEIPLPAKDKDWLRFSADYRCASKEWETWRMAMIIVEFKLNDKTIKSKSLRLFRFLNDKQTRNLYLDVKIPKKDFNKINFYYWNSGGDKPLLIDNISVEAFNS